MDFDALFTSPAWTTLSIVHALVSAAWFVLGMLAYNRVVFFMSGALVFTHGVGGLFVLAKIIEDAISAERARAPSSTSTASAPRAGTYLKELLGAIVCMAALALAPLIWYALNVAFAHDYTDAPACSALELYNATANGNSIMNTTCGSAVITSVLARTIWQDELTLVVIVLVTIGVTMVVHTVDIGYAAWLLVKLGHQRGFAQPVMVAEHHLSKRRHDLQLYY